MRWQPTERCCELHGFGDAKVVRGNQSQRMGGQRVQVKVVDRSHRRTGACRIDQDHRIGTIEEIDQPSARTIRYDDLNVRWWRRSQVTRCLQARGVVAKGAADADDADHRSTICSFRKCVAQEMHGS